MLSLKAVKSFPKTQLLLFFYLFFLSVFYFSHITPYTDWGGDYGMYLSHAKNIAEGKKYTDTGFYPNPNRIICPEFYPPVFPLLLAPMYKLFGKNIIALKVIGLLSLLLFLFYLFRLFKEEFNTFYAWTSVLFFGFYPMFVKFVTHYILSDIPFLAFTYLFLYYARKYLKNNDLSTKKLLFLGLLAYLAYGTRTAGIVLPLAFSGEIILKALQKRLPRTHSLKILFTINGTFAFFFLLEKLLLGSDSLHAKVLEQTTLQIFLDNLFNYYPRTFFHKFYWFFGQPPSFWFSFKNALTLFFVLFTFLGLFRKCRKDFGTSELFVIGYFLLLLIWPKRQGIRFLFPLLPILLFYFFYGMQILKEKIRRIISLVFLFSSLLLFGVYYSYALPAYQRIPPGPFLPEMQKVLNFLETEMPDSSVLVSDFVRPMGFFIDKKVTYVDPINMKGLEKLEQRVKNIDYLLFLPRGTRYHRVMCENIEPFIRKDTIHWEKIYQTDFAIVYRRKK